MASPQFGAALQYIQKQLGGPTSDAEDTVVVNTTATKIIGYDPDAVGLLLLNVGNYDMYIGRTPQVALSAGIFLGKNGGSMSLNVVDDFTLPTLEWFGIADSAASSIYFLRVKRYTTIAT